MAQQNNASGKNNTVVIVALIVLLIGLGVGAFFMFGKKKGDVKELDDASGGPVTGPNNPISNNVPAPDPPPPPQGNGNNNTNQGASGSGSSDEVEVLDPETGVGLETINRRMQDLYKDRNRLYRIMEVNGISNDPTQGQTKQSAWRNLLTRTFGGDPFAWVPAPRTMNARVRLPLQVAASIDPTFDKRSQSTTKERALDDLKIYADFTGVGGPLLFNESVKQDIEAGIYGDSGSADRDKSERYDKFEADLKILASNYLNMQENTEAALRVAAVEDLRSKGWKFFGYDA